MSKFKEKIVHEFKTLLPVTLYFLFVNELLAITHRVLLQEYGITVSSFARAVVIALVVAKVVLILDHISIMNIFSRKPRLAGIVWKTVMYFVATVLIQLIEGVLHAFIATGSLGTAYTTYTSETVWARFYLVQMWMFVLLFNYCFIRELGKDLKSGGIVSLLFRPQPDTSRSA